MGDVTLQRLYCVLLASNRAISVSLSVFTFQVGLVANQEGTSTSMKLPHTLRMICYLGSHSILPLAFLMPRAFSVSTSSILTFSVQSGSHNRVV